LNAFSFHKNGEVQQHPIEISSRNLTKLDDNLMLVYTNISRDANAVLTQTNQVDNFSILKNIKNQAIEVET
jgi:galactokinase/mevalonate kinase-like predicted kinase